MMNERIEIPGTRSISGKPCSYRAGSFSYEEVPYVQDHQWHDYDGEWTGARITSIEFAEKPSQSPLLWNHSYGPDKSESLKNQLLSIPNDTDPSAFCAPWIYKLEKKELMKLEAILTELREGEFIASHSWFPLRFDPENDDFLLGLLVIVGSFCETYPVSLSKFSGPDCIYVEPGTLEEV
tara:strand:+ start:2603 stop:3142 length:540 start_codon:yes stop_codon:yes gene_type:complete